MHDLRDVLDLLDKLVLPLIGYGAWVLRDIRDHLRILNGRLTRAEQWGVDHEKQDEERFTMLRQEHMMIRREMGASGRE